MLDFVYMYWWTDFSCKETQQKNNLLLCLSLGFIRPFLAVETAAELPRSRIRSRIDYCSSLLAGIIAEHIVRLQKIQSHAARLTFHKKRHDHVTPLLKKLHWIPV